MLPSLDCLQCFERAARLLNFSKAARTVGLTPCAFGQRIQKLENQLGTKLFERTTRTIRLTDAGTALLKPAMRCISLAEETLRVARGDKSPAPTSLVVGTRHELGLSWLIPQIDRLETAIPGLQLHVYCGSGPDLLLRVRTMDIDCAVTSSRFSDPKLDSFRLHREDYVFCGSSALLDENPLRRPEDAKRHTLFDISADVPLFKYWRDASQSSERLRFRRFVWLGSIEPIHQRILAGAGVGVLPEHHTRSDLESGRLRRVFPKIEPLHDYHRLVFRSDDPRRSVYEDLARSLMEEPLR